MLGVFNMPYITQKERKDLENGKPIETAGQLNYTITTIILEYLVRNGKQYQTINDIIGALEGAKAEFQRRVVAPYEDIKIKENGDV
jgi:hypothetical protein